MRPPSEVKVLMTVKSATQLRIVGNRSPVGLVPPTEKTTVTPSIFIQQEVLWCTNWCVCVCVSETLTLIKIVRCLPGN